MYTFLFSQIRFSRNLHHRRIVIYEGLKLTDVLLCLQQLPALGTLWGLNVLFYDKTFRPIGGPLIAGVS